MGNVTNQLVQLQDQIHTLQAEVEALSAALEGKQDRLVLKKGGLSAEELDAIAEEARQRARLDSTLADNIAKNRSS